MDDAGSSEPDGDEDGDELREPGGDILHENNWTSPQWSEYKMVIRREQEQWSSIPLLRAKANWKTVGWGHNNWEITNQAPRQRRLVLVVRMLGAAHPLGPVHLRHGPELPS